jgi:hypothetical protein
VSDLLFSLITVRSDTYLPGAILVLLFILLYLVHSGTFAPNAKSVLSPELESKRIAIMERHNLLVGVIGFVPLTLFVLLLLLAAVLGYSLPRSFRVGALLTVVCGEVYGLFRLLKYDEIMCERLGFICPHCCKPLYEPRSFISINGLCPKCHRPVILQGASLSPKPDRADK